MSKWLQGSSILLYGDRMIGKSTFCSTFPTPIVWISSDNTLTYVPNTDDIIGIYGPDQWAELKRYIKGPISKSKASTIVVDNVAGIYNSIFLKTVAKEGHPSQRGDYGRSIWHNIKMEFLDVLAQLTGQAAALGATLLFIAHTRKEEVDTRTKSYTKRLPDLPGSLRDVLPGNVSHIFFMDYLDDEDAAPGSRVLVLKGDEYARAETRDQHMTVSKIKLTTEKGEVKNGYKLLSYVFDKAHKEGNDG